MCVRAIFLTSRGDYEQPDYEHDLEVAAAADRRLEHFGGWPVGDPIRLIGYDHDLPT